MTIITMMSERRRSEATYNTHLFTRRSDATCRYSDSGYRIRPLPDIGGVDFAKGLPIDKNMKRSRVRYSNHKVVSIARGIVPWFYSQCLDTVGLCTSKVATGRNR